VLVFQEDETTRVSLKASLNKNIHFLYLPFVTISMYLATPDHWRQRRILSGAEYNRDRRHLGHHFNS
jgi:hypothetical protein